jgi:branched-chain amino acid transport system ATP-binding protein
MSTTTPILQVKGLRAGYGRAEVLHGIDIQAAPGGVITVIGPNGAGKSTLLNTLMASCPARARSNSAARTSPRSRSKSV